MPRLIDEQCEDDEDGTDWAQKHTHSVPETYVDPTIAAIFPESEVDEQGYVLGWSEIASQKRFQVDHCCQICGRRLKEKPHLLHIHHLDRNKANSDPANLQARCILCHAEAGGHSHILSTVPPSDLAYVRGLPTKRA